MLNLSSQAVILVTTLACVGFISDNLRADRRPQETLDLASAYTGRVLVDGARRVSLSLTLDDKGNGSGVLGLDPNVRDGDTSTAAAVLSIPVRVRLVRDEEQVAKGRQLYELSWAPRGDGPEGAGPGPGGRWFLVKSLQKGAPCWLVFTGEDGVVQDVLTLG
jgi:hypothetical protein